MSKNNWKVFWIIVLLIVIVIIFLRLDYANRVSKCFDQAEQNLNSCKNSCTYYYVSNGSLPEEYLRCSDQCDQVYNAVFNINNPNFCTNV